MHFHTDREVVSWNPLAFHAAPEVTAGATFTSRWLEGQAATCQQKLFFCILSAVKKWLVHISCTALAIPAWRQTGIDNLERTERIYIYAALKNTGKKYLNWLYRLSLCLFSLPSQKNNSLVPYWQQQVTFDCSGELWGVCRKTTEN